MSFEAKYRGICASCDETIFPGDEIEYEDDDVIHSHCGGSVPRDVTRRPFQTRDSVCPTCSLEHRGECM